MRYTKTFSEFIGENENFLNEASAKVGQNFNNRSKGWGLPEDLSYASTISYSGGKMDVLILPTVPSGRAEIFGFTKADAKQLGSVVSIIEARTLRNPRSRQPFTYADRDSLLDLISGIKEVVKLIPSAWKEFENLPQTSKDSVIENLEKLAPVKTLEVRMIGEPKGGRPGPSKEVVGNRYTIIPAQDNGDQAAVNDEIKKVFPGAYDIGKNYFFNKAEDMLNYALISFKANI